MQDAELRDQLAAQRRHVLDAVAGLGADDLQRVVVPSGWSITRLLNHLAYDDEMFWIGAVLGADPQAVEDLHDGWRSEPMSGREASLPETPRNA